MSNITLICVVSLTFSVLTFFGLIHYIKVAEERIDSCRKRLERVECDTEVLLHAVDSLIGRGNK